MYAQHFGGKVFSNNLNSFFNNLVFGILPPKKMPLKEIHCFQSILKSWLNTGTHVLNELSKLQAILRIFVDSEVVKQALMLFVLMIILKLQIISLSISQLNSHSSESTAVLFKSSIM